LTAGLAYLSARMTARRLDYLKTTTVGAYERALRTLRSTVALDAMGHELARGDQPGMMPHRETALADTVEWVLRKEDRIVLAAHNGHVQRSHGTMPGMPPMTPMGLHLADRLGADYVVIGTTSGTGRMLNPTPEFYTGTLFADMGEAPEPGSLDALMAASHDGPFATDLRRLSPADAATVGAVSQQRFGAYYSELNPVDAYDVIVHLPHVTPAEPDEDTLAHSPEEVRKAFSRWKPE
jgi:erythromycin esterase